MCARGLRKSAVVLRANSRREGQAEAPVGWRFRRSLRVAPGVRLNLTRTGWGVTFGRRGAHYSIHSSGRRTVSAGFPGTGLYWQNTTTGKPLFGASEGLDESSRTATGGGGSSNTATDSSFEQSRRTSPEHAAPTIIPDKGRRSRFTLAWSRLVPEGGTGRLVCIAVLLAATIAGRIAVHPRALSNAVVASGAVALTVFLVMAAQRWLGASGPARPSVPRLDRIPQVVIHPEPPLRVVVPASSCRVCGRPLSDPVSRHMGVGPDCRARYGPKQFFADNPAHVAWGDRLHTLLLQRERAVEAATQRYEQASATHKRALDAWQAERTSPAGVARQRQRSQTGRVILAAGAALIVVYGVRHAGLQTTPVSSAAPLVATPTTETPTPDPTVTTYSPAPQPTATQVSVAPPPPPPPKVPPPPSPTDNRLVRVVPDCVGDVCRVVQRVDVVTHARTGVPGSRVTLALVRFPNDRNLGPEYRLIAVNDRTHREVLQRTSSFYGNLQSVSSFRSDAHGNVGIIVSTTMWLPSIPGYDAPAGPANITVAAVTVTGHRVADASPIDGGIGQAVAANFLPDRHGYLRWSVRSTDALGPQTITTYGWRSGSYGFDVVGCAKTRNGDIIRYAPQYGDCST